jgi:beta-lactamase regulating signal transducer with metallopeptidase domain
MNAMQLLTGPVSQSIGWALLHLLWQATIVAGILAAVLALLPRQAATTRYAAACSALGLVFAMFVATAIRADDPIVATESSSAGNVEPVPVSLAEVPALIAATATAGWRDRAVQAVATARQWLPSIVGLWLSGVVLLSARLLVSWLRARRLVTHGTREAGAQWQRAAARISEALGLDRAVRLLESAAVEVPSVLGSFRPVILLPASTLTGLTPEQIEMVLAHELAHIRRHDFLVNLMQAFVETLMFYHPAIWWMSRSVRIERENCCDDLAVAVCGNPISRASKNCAPRLFPWWSRRTADRSSIAFAALLPAAPNRPGQPRVGPPRWSCSSYWPLHSRCPHSLLWRSATTTNR